MNVEDKKLIFNLLKNASAINDGYIDENLKNEPVFTDDIEINSNISESPVKESHGKTLEEINTKIAKCTRCILARTRNNVISGEGVNNPDVLVILDSPGTEEDIQGIPAAGKTGFLLDKMLSAIQLNKNSNCYITNLVKCHVPNEKTPDNNEINACMSFLEAQIHILKPKMILCMSNTAGQKLLNIEQAVEQLHGDFYEYNHIPIMITYSPAVLLKQEELKRPAWNDLKKFKARLAQ